MKPRKGRKKVNPELIDEDNPEWTDEDFARARPTAEVMPHLLDMAVAKGKRAKSRRSPSLRRKKS